jgi:hypothetical protein
MRAGAMLTGICTAVTTIFSIIIAGFLITCRKMGAHAPSGKHQIKRMFMGH